MHRIVAPPPDRGPDRDFSIPCEPTPPECGPWRSVAAPLPAGERILRAEVVVENGKRRVGVPDARREGAADVGEVPSPDRGLESPRQRPRDSAKKLALEPSARLGDGYFADTSDKMILWRRFDIIFPKKIDFENLRRDLVYAIQAIYNDDRLFYKFLYDWSMSDFLVMSSRLNMLKILGITKDNVLEYLKFIKLPYKRYWQHQEVDGWLMTGGFNFILAAHLMNLNLFNRIYYLFKENENVFLTKSLIGLRKFVENNV